MTRKEIVNMIAATLRSIEPTARSILFGSEARGEATDESDIDILILVDGTKISIDREESITTPLYEIELKTGVAISPLVMTKQEWENRPIKTPFYYNILKEGILL